MASTIKELCNIVAELKIEKHVSKKETLDGSGQRIHRRILKAFGNRDIMAVVNSASNTYSSNESVQLMRWTVVGEATLADHLRAQFRKYMEVILEHSQYQGRHKYDIRDELYASVSWDNLKTNKYFQGVPIRFAKLLYLPCLGIWPKPKNLETTEVSDLGFVRMIPGTTHALLCVETILEHFRDCQPSSKRLLECMKPTVTAAGLQFVQLKVEHVCLLNAPECTVKHTNCDAALAAFDNPLEKIGTKVVLDFKDEREYKGPCILSKPMRVCIRNSLNLNETQAQRTLESVTRTALKYQEQLNRIVRYTKQKIDEAMRSRVEQAWQSHIAAMREYVFQLSDSCRMHCEWLSRLVDLRMYSALFEEVCGTSFPMEAKAVNCAMPLSQLDLVQTIVDMSQLAIIPRVLQGKLTAGEISGEIRQCVGRAIDKIQSTFQMLRKYTQERFQHHAEQGAVVYKGQLEQWSHTVKKLELAFAFVDALRLKSTTLRQETKQIEFRAQDMFGVSVPVAVASKVEQFVDDVKMYDRSCQHCAHPSLLEVHTECQLRANVCVFERVQSIAKRQTKEQMGTVALKGDGIVDIVKLLLKLCTYRAFRKIQSQL